MQPGSGDPLLYDYAPYRGRPKVVWPGGKTVAVWVAPNLEYYEIDPPVHPQRKAWARPLRSSRQSRWPIGWRGPT